MSAELALANQIKPQGLKVISASDFDASTMLDVTQDIEDTGVTINGILEDSSIIATYQLNDNALDDGGNYDGVENVISYTTGVFGKSAVFNGSTSHIVTTGVLGNAITNQDLTIGFWFKLDVIGANARSMFFIGDIAGGDDYLHMGVLSDSRLYTTGRLGTSGSNTSYGPSTVVIDQWYFTTFTRSGSIVTTYINGVAGTPINSSEFTSNFSTREAYFGRGIADRMVGGLDRIHVFNKALTATEVMELYNGDYNIVVLPILS